jgi:hypothetical protein
MLNKGYNFNSYLLPPSSEQKKEEELQGFWDTLLKFPSVN